MKTLLSRILLALMVSTILALLVTSVVSGLALQRGFTQFLERQEERQLSLLVPELAAFYRSHGSWAPLRRDPAQWMQLLARSRPGGVRPPVNGRPQQDGRHARRSEDRPWWRGPRRIPGHDGLPGEMAQLWRRLFVLDAERTWVAGAGHPDAGESRLAAIDVDGRTVGWVGFRTIDVLATPEAGRFMNFQRHVIVVSLLIALVVAAALGLWLARNIARPVSRVRGAVAGLTTGDFTARTGVDRRDEIGVLARHVDRLAETLERNRDARRRWTAEIAHELRTPVAILRGELDAMRDGIRPLDAAALDSLHEEVDQLARLIDDLQTLTRADAGMLELRRERLDAAALVRQVLDAFGERIRGRGLRLDASLPPHLDLTADPQRLRQVLHNLLENACRYSAAGGAVRVRLARDKGWAQLDIEDSPPGVGPGQRAHLFERFYRGDESRARSSGGSGLGLAICREIVESHGGEIEARDSALGGLGIRVRLPLDG